MSFLFRFSAQTRDNNIHFGCFPFLCSLFYSLAHSIPIIKACSQLIRWIKWIPTTTIYCCGCFSFWFWQHENTKESGRRRNDCSLLSISGFSSTFMASIGHRNKFEWSKIIEGAIRERRSEEGNTHGGLFDSQFAQELIVKWIHQETGQFSE